MNLTSKARRRLKQIPDIEHQASSIEHRDEGIPLVGRVAAGLPVEAVENKD
ncbi:MAG: hypothetical protein WBL85_03050 [Sedimentisphaerales bacterium]